MPARPACERRTAPLVFIGETHTYPHPGVGRRAWSMAYTHARGRRSSPASATRIPWTALSWAIFLLDYGEWLHATALRERSAVVPTHNAAYKREVLLEHGPRTGAGPGPRRPARQSASDSARSPRRTSNRPRRSITSTSRRARAPGCTERFLGGLRDRGAAGPMRWSGGSAADLFLRVATHPGRVLLLRMRPGRCVALEAPRPACGHPAGSSWPAR